MKDTLVSQIKKCIEDKISGGVWQIRSLLFSHLEM